MEKRILVCGNVNLAIDTVFDRAAAVSQKAGPFDALVFAGAFLPDEVRDASTVAQLQPYIKGERKVPLPTYFFHRFMEPSLVCDDLFCLGSFGVMDVAGLQVGFLWEETAANVFLHSVDSGLRSAGLDLLFLRSWPKMVAPHRKGETSEDAARACLELAPRYVFVPANEPGAESQDYFERAPFRNPKHKTHVTRFLAVADVTNSRKQKWLYAFKVAPAERTPDLVGAAEENPFYVHRERPAKQQRIDQDGGAAAAGGDFQRWANVGEGGNNNNNNNNDGRRGKGQQQQQQKRQLVGDRGPECWFCLDTPKVEQHLLVSIGNEAYVAMAKGALTNDHVLIVPIAHTSNTGELQKQQLAEIEQYKSCLRQMFSADGRQMIFFERFCPTRYERPHCLIQALPIPSDSLSVIDEKLQTWSKIPSSGDATFPYQALRTVTEGRNYFWIQAGNQIYYMLEPDKVPLEFGRQLYAEVVGNIKKTHWKSCVLPKDKETKQTDGFKERFKPFDKVLG